MTWTPEAAATATAVATVFIALFTVILAIVGGVQGWLTWKAIQATNRALTTTERAFVFLDDFDLDWQRVVQDNVPRLQRFIIKPRWRNSGTTPTRNNVVRINWTTWEGDLPGGFEYKFGNPPDGIAPVPLFLGPQATEWSAPIEIPKDVSIKASNQQTNIYIWGRADYQDIFENTRPHWIKWCYRIYIYQLGGDVRTQFVAFGPHNRSDEDRPS